MRKAGLWPWHCVRIQVVLGWGENHLFVVQVYGAKVIISRFPLEHGSQSMAAEPEATFSGPTPALLNQKLVWGPSNLCFRQPSREFQYTSLITIALGNYDLEIWAVEFQHKESVFPYWTLKNKPPLFQNAQVSCFYTLVSNKLEKISKNSGSPTYFQ